MEARSFYWLWFKRTVWGAPTAADLYVGLVGAVAAIVVHFKPWLRPMVEANLWQVPIWAFGAILAFRFFHAPFQIWKEDQARLSLLDTQEKRAVVRQALSAFLVEGSARQHACADETAPPDTAGADAWYAGVIEYLGNDLDQSYVARMNDDSTVPMGANSIPSVPHRNLWADCAVRIFTYSTSSPSSLRPLLVGATRLGCRGHRVDLSNYIVQRPQPVGNRSGR